MLISATPMSEALERLVPDRRLSLDGEVVPVEIAAKITRVTCDLHEDVFNECRIVFTDPDLALINGKKLVAGVGVFLELGYVGKLKAVFDGEIVSVEPRFVRDQPPSVVVRALERLHRLALAPNTRSFTEVDASEIVGIIAKEHGLSGEGPSGSKGHLLQPNISDFSLLRKIAARTGNRVSLSGKKLVIGPPPSLGEIECLPGSGLKRLKVRLRTTEQVPKVIVRGWDQKDKKEIVGQATPAGEAGDGAKDAKSFERTEFYIEGVLVGDTAEAEKIAKATIARIAERYATADGEILGNPDVIPGKLVNFDKFGELLDGKYRVTGAKHEFDKRGYRVGFTATRVAKKQSAVKFKAAEQKKEKKEEKTVTIETVLKDSADEPMADRKVTIEIEGGEKKELSTDASGNVKIEKIKKGTGFSIIFHPKAVTVEFGVESAGGKALTMAKAIVTPAKGKAIEATPDAEGNFKVEGLFEGDDYTVELVPKPATAEFNLKDSKGEIVKDVKAVIETPRGSKTLSPDGSGNFKEEGLFEGDEFHVSFVKG